MLSTTRVKVVERAIGSVPSILLPSFLLPAFPVTSRAFSASPSNSSHTGKTPLSIPPEVNFTVIRPVQRKNARYSANPARPVAEIEGPLGTIHFDPHGELQLIKLQAKP